MILVADKEERKMYDLPSELGCKTTISVVLHPSLAHLGDRRSLFVIYQLLASCQKKNLSSFLKWMIISGLLLPLRWYLWYPYQSLCHHNFLSAYSLLKASTLAQNHISFLVFSLQHQHLYTPAIIIMHIVSQKFTSNCFF